MIITQERPKKGGADDAVIATRAVELLRASFLETHLEMPEPAPPDPPAAPSAEPALTSDGGTPDAAPLPPKPETAAPLKETPPRGAARPSDSTSPLNREIPGPRDSSRKFPKLGDESELRLIGVLAGSASPGGVPTDGHLGLGLSLDLSGHWSASGLLLSPSLFSQVEGDEGSAALHVSVGLVELAWTGGSRLEPVLGAGGGVAWLLTSGDPASGFAAQSDGSVVPLGVLRAGLGWQLSDTLRAALDARVGATANRVAVRFDTREVAEWGRPLVLLSAGVEVRLD